MKRTVIFYITIIEIHVVEYPNYVLSTSSNNNNDDDDSNSKKKNLYGKMHLTM